MYVLNINIEYWDKPNIVQNHLLYVERKLNAKFWSALPGNRYVISLREDIKAHEISSISYFSEYTPYVKVDDRALNLHIVTCNDNINIRHLFDGDTYRYFSASYSSFHKGVGNMATLSFDSQNHYMHVTDLLKKHPSILYIESISKNYKHNVNALKVGLGEKYVNSKSVDNMLSVDYGRDSIVTVGDSGLDVSHCYFSRDNNRIIKRYISESNYDVVSDQILNEDIKHDKIFAYLAVEFNIGRHFYTTDFVDEINGHGTHVTGSAVGGHMESMCKHRMGLHSKAKVLFIDYQDNINSEDEDALNVPQSLYWVMQTSYNLGSRIFTNSWGGDTTGYSFHAYEVDLFIHNNPDYSVIFSAGNDGPGVSTIKSPGISKNAITVGSTFNSYQSFVEYNENQYELNRNGSTLTNNTNIKYFNENQLSDFSSRGPTLDGRIKPDVVFPGEFILSARSNNILKTKFSADELMIMRGTSMASPLVASILTLIEDRLKRVYHIKYPLSSLKKVILITSTKRLTGSSQKFIVNQGTNEVYIKRENKTKLTVYDQGFGRVSLNQFIEGKIGFIENIKVSAFSKPIVYYLKSTIPTHDAVITIVYDDVPHFFTANSTDKVLINNISIRVIQIEDVGGTEVINKVYDGNNIYRDSINNVEQVRFQIKAAALVRILISTNGPIVSIKEDKVQTQSLSMGWSGNFQQVYPTEIEACTKYDPPYQCIHPVELSIGHRECQNNLYINNCTYINDETEHFETCDDKTKVQLCSESKCSECQYLNEPTPNIVMPKLYRRDLRKRNTLKKPSKVYFLYVGFICLVFLSTSVVVVNQYIRLFNRP